MTYGKRVLIAFDQMLNALLGNWPDETLSSQAWRWHRDRIRHWPCKALDTVFGVFGDKEHCKESYTSEVTRRQFPPELRDKK